MHCCDDNCCSEPAPAAATDACCDEDCCGAEAKAKDRDAGAGRLKVQLLFLDENVCKPCGGTSQALDEAVELVSAGLEAMGTRLEVERIHIATREDAIDHRLITSPTIRINGVDIDPDRTQDECETCGDIAGGDTKVDCRTWHWRGEVHSSAPVGKIVEAILAAAVSGKSEPGSDCGCGVGADHSLPENLERFFQARQDAGRSGCQV